MCPADGKYLNSATRGGPIPINYKLEADDDSGDSFAFLIEAPDEHKFGRAAGPRIREGRLITTYFDGRVLTYSRISRTPDRGLLVSPAGKHITVQANGSKAGQTGAGQTAAGSEWDSAGVGNDQLQSDGRSR